MREWSIFIADNVAPDRPVYICTRSVICDESCKTGLRTYVESVASDQLAHPRTGKNMSLTY